MPPSRQSLGGNTPMAKSSVVRSFSSQPVAPTCSPPCPHWGWPLPHASHHPTVRTKFILSLKSPASLELQDMGDVLFLRSGKPESTGWIKELQVNEFQKVPGGGFPRTPRASVQRPSCQASLRQTLPWAHTCTGGHGSWIPTSAGT